jgi:hypothetical protein
MTVAFSVDGGQAAGDEPGFGQGLIDQRDEHLAHQRADDDLSPFSATRANGPYRSSTVISARCRSADEAV